MAVTLEYGINGSGKSARATAKDDQGNPVDITAVATGDAVHRIAITATPTDHTTSLSLTFSSGGVPAAAQATTLGPPLNRFEWVATGLAAGSYGVQINSITQPTNDPAAVLEFYDGTTFLASSTINQNNGAGNAAPVADPTLLMVSGSAVQRIPVADNLAVNSGTLRVRLTCGPSYYLWANDLWVVRHSDGSVARRVTSAIPPATVSHLTSDADFVNFVPYTQQVDDGTIPISMRGSGSSLRHLIDPAALQAKLEAVLGSGNVTVTVVGPDANSLQVRYVGALAGQAMPLLTCSPPESVSITLDTQGGILPTFHRQDGTQVRAKHEWIFWDETVPHFSSLTIHFPQAPPQWSGPSLVANDLNTVSGGWSFGGGGLSDQVRIASDTSATATWRYGPWAPSTIKVYATWSPSAGRTTDATHTIRDANGTTLATAHANQTLAPSGITRDGATWQLLAEVTLVGRGNRLVTTQSNGSTGPMVADAYLYERTSADDSVIIAPGEAVTVTSGTNWLTCGGSQAPAVTAGAVINDSGGRCYTLPTEHEMLIGENIGGTSIGGAAFRYLNVARVTQAFGDYPTTQHDAVTAHQMTLNTNAYLGKAKAMMPVAPGRWILAWKGNPGTGRTSLIDLYCNYTEGRLTEITDDPAATSFPAAIGQWNVRVYDALEDIQVFGPSFQIQVHGSAPTGDGAYFADFTDLKIVPHGTDLDNHREFTDAAYIRDSKLLCSRWMDSIGTNVHNATYLTDLLGVPGRLSVDLPNVTLSPGIARIEAYTGPMSFYKIAGAVIKVTTTTPHGFSPYQRFQIQGYSGPDVQLSNGSTLNSWGQYLDGIIGVAWLIDATSFAFQVGTPHAPALTMTNTIVGPPGNVVVTRGVGFPLEDQAAIARDNDYRAVHLSLPFAMLPSETYKLGKWVAENGPTRADFKVYLEMSNETWNWGTAAATTSSQGGAILYGVDGENTTQFTCEQAAIQWPQFEAGWVAGGRDVKYVRRTMGVNLYDGFSTSAARASYCQDHGIVYHAECGAPYLNISQAFANVQATMGPVIDGLVPEQEIDIWELYARDGGYERYHETLTGRYRQNTDGSWPYPLLRDIEGVFYEGGPDNGWVKGGSDYAAGKRAHAVFRSARSYGIEQLIMSRWAGSGIAMYNHYVESTGDTALGSGWSSLHHSGELPYEPGDPAQDAIQDADFDNIPLLRSTTQGAMAAMAAKYRDSTPTPDFAVAVAGPATVARGTTAHFTVTMTPSGGYAGTAALTARNLPADVTPGGFTPGSLVASSALTADLALAVGSAATPGAATATVRAADSANGLTHDAPFSFTVTGGSTPPAPTGYRRRLPLRRKAAP